MASSIYQIARQRIAASTINAPTKKVTLSKCGHLVKAKEPSEKHEPTPEEIEERKARQRKYSHDWYMRHKAEHNEKCREWAKNHRDKARNFSKNYYWAHKEERNEASKKWRDEHKEIYNARMRAYRKRKKERAKASPRPLNLARFRAFLFIKILHIFIKNILTNYKKLCIL